MPIYTPGRRRAIALLLLTSVLLLTLDLRGNAVFDAARAGFTKVMDPFESAAEVVTRPVRNAWRGITDYPEQAERIRELEEQLDAARSDQVRSRAATVDFEALLRLNNLESLSDYPTVVAKVIGESPSNVDQVLEINKGSDDGIEVGMAVVNEAGLVGKITSVLPDRARIMLVTDARYAVSVRIVPGEPPTTTTTTTTVAGATTTTDPEASTPTSGPAASPPADGITTSSTSTTTTTSSTVPGSPPTTVDPAESTTSTSTTTTTTIPPGTPRETGRLTGQGAGRLPQVDLLEDTPVFGRLQRGDIIITAGGTDSLAPLDIPVGVVENVVTRSTAEGPMLEIEPLADLDRLYFVRIVLYKPESEADPAGDGEDPGG